MKHYKFIISLCIIGCAMMACGKRNTPNEPTGNEDPKEQSMLERAQEFATFLTDNYQKGDSVYFTHTIVSTSESFREGFAVTVNEFHELYWNQKLENCYGEVFK